MLPAFVSIVGIGVGHWATAKLTAMIPGPKKFVAVGVAAGILGLAAWSLPKLSFVPSWARNALLIGFGINLGMKIIGAFLPEGPAQDFLLGGAGGAAEQRKAVSGYGQYDVYEAGMLGTGTYGTQYAPIQGMGAYIAEPGQQLQGIGAYVQEPAGYGVDVEEAPAGMGAYVRDPSNGQFGGYGVDVQEAPAGWGGFGGTGRFADDDDDELEDSSMDSAEAAVEGLGALYNQLRGVGGHLALATPDGAEALAKSGYDVRAIKDSVRHPGVPIVAAVPSARGYKCPHCGVQGKAPGGAPVFRCWQCQRTVSAPVTNLSERSTLARGGGTWQTPPPSQGSGGQVGRNVPTGGIFQPLYAGGM